MVREEIKTACHVCHGGCGAIVTLEDGKITKIRPDPDSPLSKGRMCPKGLAGAELVYNPKRLQYPMKRAGARGEGKWKRISWDEAYDILTKNIEKIRRENGAESIVVAQGTGRRHLKHTCRFANALGTPNWIEPGTAQCFFPRVCTGMLTYGTMPVVDYYGDKAPGVILVWGSNPVVSGADAELQFHIRDAIKKGSKVIVVDPRRTELAKKAELFLQIRPGTDAALALGILNILISEHRYDAQFVEQWTHGFEALAERCREYPVELVSKLTWIPEEQIVAAARLLSDACPCALEWGCAVEHTPNCFQTVRAMALIPALLGSFDVPGGFIEGMHLMPEADILVRKLPDEQGYKRMGESQFKLLAGVGNECPAAHVPTLFHAMRTGEPYPMKGLLLFGNNGLMGFADSKKTLEAYQNMEFISCMDLFLTPTAELADLVLPAASWLEADGVYSGPSLADHVALVQKKIVQIGECKQDEEVFCELARRLHLDYEAEEFHKILNDQLSTIGEVYPDYEGLNFEKMKKLNYIEVPVTYRQYERRGKMNTPTGKVELYSTVMESMGLDPLPSYQEPPESPYSQPELLEQYPVILITGGRQHPYFISENRAIPRLRKLAPFPECELHRTTAEQHGIQAGDWVFVETLRGRITQKAKVTEDMLPGVINCQLGWWYPEVETPDHGWMESNCNILTSSEPPYDPNSGTYQLRALLCRISPNPEGHKIEERYRQSDLAL
jgi:thiosulfate reductase/polysulfide reductase chain A